MRTTILAIALAALCTSSAQAQDPKSMNKTATKQHSCMMMSDSVRMTLGLTVEQSALVKESDERCMKACAKSEANPTGKMDDVAMTAHDGEMRKILTAEQYTKWSAMCNTSKADKGTVQPRKN